MSIQTLWKRAWRFMRWLLVALGYVLAWPFWQLWRWFRRGKKDGES